MSDQESGHQEQGPPWPRSGTSDRSENEGGSLRACTTLDPSCRYPDTAHSTAEIALLDALPMGIMITRNDGEILRCNSACQKLCATSSAKLLGRYWWQLINQRDRGAIPLGWREMIDRSCPVIFEAHITTGAGRQVWTRHSIATLVPGQADSGHIHTIEDLSAIKVSEQAAQAAVDALSRERERARVTLECIGDAVISTDAGGRVAYLNAVAEGLTGWSRGQAIGQAFSRVFRVIDADTGKLTRNPAERAMESLQIVQMPANCLLKRRDGSELAIEDSAAPIMDADGRLTGAVVIFRDRKMSHESTARMAHLARHDGLTGLPNRIAFAESFEQAIRLARRHNKQVGLLFIDVDRFKQVNDCMGHDAGDCLLRQLSKTLVSCIRSTDLVCRHGGDEFVVLLSEIERAEDASHVAGKIRTVTARPTQVQDHLISLQLSIGISLYPEDGSDLASLMHRADAAMYHAKLDGGRGYRFYRAGMETPI